MSATYVAHVPSGSYRRSIHCIMAHYGYWAYRHIWYNKWPISREAVLPRRRTTVTQGAAYDTKRYADREDNIDDGHQKIRAFHDDARYSLTIPVVRHRPAIYKQTTIGWQLFPRDSVIILARHDQLLEKGRLRPRLQSSGFREAEHVGQNQTTRRSSGHRGHRFRLEGTHVNLVE